MTSPWILLLAPLALATAVAQTAPRDLVLVPGGTVRSSKASYQGNPVTVADFFIGKFEVTQKEWVQVMGSNPSRFRGDDLPVEGVSWYDCVEYCNRRSLREGLTPYYVVDKAKPDPANNNEIDDVKWTVTIQRGSNGYRLPTDLEWEYAASGGQSSKSQRYSGSDTIEEVAWYWRNAGDEPLAGFWAWPRIEANHNQTKPVGRKKPNELGLYDLSGNVREWCWDWAPLPGLAPGDEPPRAARVWRGGGWLGGEFCCEVSFRGSFEASGKGPDQGLRVCRSR